MQDLETRHLEIKAKDSTIQNLHDDLTKVVKNEALCNKPILVNELRNFEF